MLQQIGSSTKIVLHSKDRKLAKGSIKLGPLEKSVKQLKSTRSRENTIGTQRYEGLIGYSNSIGNKGKRGI